MILKYNLIAFAALALLTFEACKEVDAPDPDPKNDESIIGTWNFNGLDVLNGSTQVDGFTVVTYHSESSNEQGTVTFDTEGNMISTIGYTNTYSRTIFGQDEETTVEEVPMETDTASYTYDAGTHTLRVGEAEEAIDFEVSGLATGSIKLDAQLRRSSEQDGKTYTFSTDIQMRLSR